jgi:uncharacterized protein (TIGR02284 family)
MDTDDVIAPLNDLAETSRDGEEGFRTCADAVKNALLKQMFQQAASRCAQAVMELQAKGSGPRWRSGEARLALST